MAPNGPPVITPPKLLKPLLTKKGTLRKRPGPAPKPRKRVEQSYTRQRKIDVLLFLLNHRVADSRLRKVPRRRIGQPHDQEPEQPMIRDANGELVWYRAPTYIETSKFWKVPVPTIQGWWDAREKILEGTGIELPAAATGPRMLPPTEPPADPSAQTGDDSSKDVSDNSSESPAATSGQPIEGRLDATPATASGSGSAPALARTPANGATPATHGAPPPDSAAQPFNSPVTKRAPVPPPVASRPQPPPRHAPAPSQAQTLPPPPPPTSTPHAGPAPTVVRGHPAGPPTAPYRAQPPPTYGSPYGSPDGPPLIPTNHRHYTTSSIMALHLLASSPRPIRFTSKNNPLSIIPPNIRFHLSADRPLRKQVSINLTTTTPPPAPPPPNTTVVTSPAGTYPHHPPSGDGGRRSSSGMEEILRDKETTKPMQVSTTTSTPIPAQESPTGSLDERAANSSVEATPEAVSVAASNDDSEGDSEASLKDDPDEGAPVSTPEAYDEEEDEEMTDA
ncbi:hypothetical protein B0T25DRAFT_575706 [Lasiosphaeria hispida]|uniref:Uncharacterized protein n=1 Tax=Lasiosphaeria hispida TaxID=260671 RepID=A0AAJ0HUT5_9PEZI|nr:hypothetical protein B0T25DRAFT_575706 [Lasiosphaeria hispida]